MKKLQRIISIILVLAMVIGLIPSMSIVYASGDEENNHQLILRKGYYDENEKIFSLDLYIKDITFVATDLTFSYPKDIMEIIRYEDFEEDGDIRSVRNVGQAIESNVDETGAVIEGTSEIDQTEGWIRQYITTTANGGSYGIYDSSAKESLISRVYFHVTDDTLELFEIENSQFVLNTDVAFSVQYNATEISEDPAIFTVEGFADDTEVTLRKIEVKTNPTNLKQTYKHGEEIDLQGGRILVTYSDETTDILSMLDSNVTVTTGDQEGAFADIDCPKITFTYQEKTVDMNINVVDPVETIEFVDSENVLGAYDRFGGIPTEYGLLDEDLGENLAIKTITKSGRENIVLLKSDDVTLSDTQTLDEAGIQVVTVTYNDGNNELTTNYTIVVGDQVSSIKISETDANKPQTEYKVNDEFEKNGKIKVTGVRTGDFATEIDMSTDNVKVTELDGSEIDLSTPGTKQVLVSYLGKTVKYTINISNDVKGIEINKSISTNYNEEITQADLAGVTVKEILADGTYGQTKALNLAWLDLSNYDSSIFNTQRITVNYPTADGVINGILNVKVKDELIGITIEDLTTECIYKEELNLEGAKFYVEYLSGIQGPYELDDTSLTNNFNNEQIGEQTITFTYNDGVEAASTTAKINVIKATLDAPVVNKLTLLENQPVSELNDQLPAADTYGQIIWDNPRETVADGEAKQVKAIYKMNDTYKTFYNDVEFTIEVEGISGEIKDIALQTEPKLDYYKGQKYDDSTLVLLATYIDDSTGKIVSGYTTKIDGEVVEGDYVFDEEGTKSLEITFGDFDPIELIITVSPDEITGIVLHENDAKLEYKLGEELDLSKVTIEKVMASGIKYDEVAITDSEVEVSDNFNKTQLGEQTINVTYLGYTKSLTVTVVDFVTKIELPEETLNALKTEYKYGELLDLGNNLKLNAYMASDLDTAVPVDLTDDDVEVTIDTTKLGTQEVIIEYKGQEVKYTITVEDYIDYISVTTQPEKRVYKVDEEIDLTGLVVKDIMASGQKVTLTDDDYTVSAADTSTTGLKILTVTRNDYPTLTDEITLLVIEDDDTVEIRINELPTNKTYYGKDLDLTGGSILVRKENDDEGAIISMTDKNVTVEGYNPNQKGRQVLKLTYTYKELVDDEEVEKKLEVNLPIVVSDYRLEELVLVEPEKTQYKYGEELDLLGGLISRIMASGTIFAQSPLTSQMISGYDAEKTGTQTITVSYQNLTKTFNVTVVDNVYEVSMNSKPDKINYNYGENIDLTGATITVEKDSGIVNIPVTADMISGYNPNESGTQTITVTYAGKTVTFVVTVAAKPIPASESEGETPVVTPEDTTKPEDVTNPNTTIPSNMPTDDSNVTPDNSKETKTLGEKDKNKGDVKDTIIPAVIGLIITGSLLLLVLALTKKNVEIYVISDGERKLVGRKRINKNTKMISLDEYSDNIKDADVQVVIDSKLSNKMIGEEIKIKLDNRSTKIKIDETEDEEYIIEIKK